MQPFNLDSPDSESAAITAHARSNSSRYLAGGTTLVDLMKLNVEQPDRVVDLTALPLTKITEGENTVRIDALVTNSDCAYHPLIQKRFPVLSQALLSGASPQLRNLASIGGNLLQRTRCPYFRNAAVMACNKRRPGSGCSAIDGFNRNLAVLGGSSSCIATHASDMCVALAALDARIVTESEKGQRTINLSEFYRVPGSTPHIETILQPNELILAVEIPKRDWFSKSVYTKVRDRASYAFALTSSAVALDVSEGKIRDARVALGGVGTVPWRSKEAEAVLKGGAANEATFKRAAEAALKSAHGYGRNNFKILLAKQTLVRSLNELMTAAEARV